MSSLQLNNSLEFELSNADTFFSLGVLYRNKGNNYQILSSAINNFSNAIRLNPNKAEYYEERAEAYTTQGRDTLAINDYTKAIELSPDNLDNFKYRGDRFFSSQQTLKALDDYTYVIEKEPYNPKHHYKRGTTYFELKRFKEAIADFDQAIALSQGSNYEERFYYRERGKSYAMLTEYDKAIEDFTKLIELDPNVADNYHLRGLAYHYKGELEAARENYEHGVELGHFFSGQMLKKLETKEPLTPPEI